MFMQMTNSDNQSRLKIHEQEWDIEEGSTKTKKNLCSNGFDIIP